jgi:ABC-type multidrug transport system ATPase subunit
LLSHAGGISGGQLKRTSIAMEMVSQASLLILDEPTTGMAAAEILGWERLSRLDSGGISPVVS